MPILEFFVIFAPSFINKLILSIMIQIKVFTNDSCFKDDRSCFERIIKDSLSNFFSLIDSLRVLYGVGSVITINILPL